MKAIECKNVWKKYTKGEKIYALRDAVPQFLNGIFSKKDKSADQLADKEFWALKDVSFEVDKKEVVGIIGPNGAGKSTILKLLSGIIKPNKGEFKLNGRLSALIEITAGFHPDFTGRENVYFNGSILGMSKREIDKKFDQIVDFSGVEEFIDTPVKRYSSGMYARLGFAVAAHVNPEVLLVDEVLAVGDLNFQAKCAEKMRDLLKSGTTIALVSHNIPLVQGLCSRVVLLDHGQVLKIGTPEDVIPYYQNIVFKTTESELRKKDHRIEIDEGAPVHIPKVTICGKNYRPTDYLKMREPISIQIDYQTHRKIADPIIVLSITRADGVVCCSFNTRDSKINIKELKKEGSLVVNLENISLAPGIYYAEASVWDKDVVHPYALSHREIFRIESDQLTLSNAAVFMPDVKWAEK